MTLYKKVKPALASAATRTRFEFRPSEISIRFTG